jgi:cysteine desulfurase/selenocysteine lyase
MFDVHQIRKDFPVFNQKINGYPLAYLDNAASSQKPSQVVKTMCDYYKNDNANVHRGIHTLSERATEEYEQTREIVRSFINASSIEEIIFVKGATDGLNQAALLLADNVLQKGDTILLTLSEHHSNIVPWQLLAKRRGYNLSYVPLDSEGHYDLEAFQKLITEKVKVLALQHISNVTGIVHPIESMIKKAKELGIYTVVDACQSAPHYTLDVQKMDCDFLTFSSHKMLGPTGFGILYGRRELLEKFEPVFGGGDMISEVNKDYSTWNQLPYKYEPGTPHIAGSVGLGAAITYLEKIGMGNIHEHEMMITEYTLQKLQEIPQVHIIGPKTTKDKIGVVPFTIEGIHPHDIAQVLDQYGVAIRVGHHCAQLLHKSLSLPASARASFYLYTTKEEIDQFIDALHQVIKMFS